jgi:Ser/Thr protein kinase RdoA (MazF antagonist)
MVDNESAIPSIVKRFCIGRFQKVVKQLESGFASDNYHILTSQGEYVLRVISDTVDNVEYSMSVCEYLGNHGIKTPKPARTQEGTFTLSHQGRVIAIQAYLPGADIWEPLAAIDPRLPFYGRELGNLHRISLQMVQEQGENRFSGREDDITYVLKAGQQYMPDDAYIQQQYRAWKTDIRQLPTDQLTRAVIHGDIGPKDFFFEADNFTGILDFGAAHLDYLLCDLAPMMMYCQLYQPHRMTQYQQFKTAYLETTPMLSEELHWLPFILRTRWLLQIFFHQSRYIRGITQGLDTTKAEENLNGVIHGKTMLQITTTYPENHFYTPLFDH